ncbi:zinc ribbon domain-containing protein [Cytobacillus firmus]|uniref:Zinc ribbon domain-containing protein n=2 Tax=Cytobacillus firmus TaxID=1399 RepID=A0A800MRR8_CYTFI|nr:hypothetical protein KIS1582_5002 [Cytobacillus firmus]
MICSNCSHKNDGGRFCENCGSPLTQGGGQEAAVAMENASASPTTSGQSNKYIESTKNISKMYFGYFMQVIKKPYASAQAVGAEHFINGLITIVLYSFIIPLMFYFALKGILADMNSFSSGLFGEELQINPPFADVVIKPAFAYAIFIMLVAVFSFAAIKLGRINASFQEVVARFGSFLIPFVALLAIALIMSILKIKLFLLFLFLGFVGSIFMVPPLVIASYKKSSEEGVDVIYGSLITYILTFVAIAIMGDMLFNTLKDAFSDIFGLFGGL